MFSPEKLILLNILYGLTTASSQRLAALYFILRNVHELNNVRWCNLMTLMTQFKQSCLQVSCLSQVDFWMEPLKDHLNATMCIPGWAARPVSRADQAFFELKSIDCTVLLHKTGESDLDFSATYLNVPQDSHPLVAKVLSNGTPHLVVKLTVQCMCPLDNIDAKLDEDLKSQRKIAEKQVRQMVTSVQKAKAKAGKKKKPQAPQAPRRRGQGKMKKL